MEQTQIYAVAVCERRRATVPAMEFGGTRKRRPTEVERGNRVVP